jgi:hypothetical protein
MARRRKSRIVVPEARAGIERLKAEVMRREGYAIDQGNPDNVKFEVARRLGVPLNPGYNGDITAEAAGKIGGRIGGAMVREMVRMAQHSLAAAHQAAGSADPFGDMRRRT